MSRPALDPPAEFVRRHNGPRADDVRAMLEVISGSGGGGVRSLEELAARAIPDDILLHRRLDLPGARSERDVIAALGEMANQNEVWRSYIGLGYHGTFTPPVILRNILENPGWYTQYTPYQAEISQGRLEALLNYQTMVADLTGMGCANASMLDEATAAAEAMTMLRRVNRKAKSDRFLVADTCHPQTIAVVETRAEPLGIEVVVAPLDELDLESGAFGVLLQYPDTFGAALDHRAFVERAHAANVLVAVASDLLALCLLEAPGTWGADVVVGNSQRFGVPLGYGGPHAAFFATRDEHKRQMPGRLVGVSKDATGAVGLRLALQTREQHIRREKATSNICTAQVLLAIVAGAYATYHGPEGLKAIAERVHLQTAVLRLALERLGYAVREGAFFDTLTFDLEENPRAKVIAACGRRHINLNAHRAGALTVALDETVAASDLQDLIDALAEATGANTLAVEALADEADWSYTPPLERGTPWLEHPVFHTHRSETEMLRYLHRLESRDLSLTTSMIPLGSCTMKLNATTEMIPVTWPSFGALHPFAPREQAKGYDELFTSLERKLAEITGFHGVSLQPNAGSQGEYAGLLVIRAYQKAQGEDRDVCLIPESAHGTNPASATLAGMRVVIVKCDDHGNIDLEDLQAKAAQHRDRLAALMVTYPSTHGVFEHHIRAVCDAVHEHGGLVYLDGANLNAQVGLTRPGDYGADVCHLNLHKTFCIPHGGGGPGMGPIAVTEALSPFLPGHPLTAGVGGAHAIGPVSAAPWGSPSILPISWAYIALLGAEGLEAATRNAILNANYMAARLKDHFPILYTGESGLCAHEFILNCKAFKDSADISVEDIAKRLMDYGFHAPTMSWPVAGTLMVEPTESESKAECDRLVDALIAIRAEIRDVEEGRLPRDDNPLKNAPHTAKAVAGEWPHPYSRERAVYPAPWTREHKFWPPVARVDNVYGDRNVVCACPPLSAYES